MFPDSISCPKFNHRILPKHDSQDKKMLIGTGHKDGNTQEGREKDEQMNRADGGRTKTDKMLVEWHNHHSRHKTLESWAMTKGWGCSSQMWR